MKPRLIEHTDNFTRLIIRTKMATLISKTVPGAFVCEVEYDGTPSAVNIPWTLQTAQMVANMGAPVISPILRDYQFTGRYKPYLHQLKICSFLTANKRGYCFADMGTGKSLAVVHAVRYLLSVGEIKRVLVVAPLTTLSRTWESEFFNVDPSLRPTKLHGEKAKRIELAAIGSPVHIINYEGIEVIFNELKANAYDCIVIDELTAYATHTTNRWKSAKRLFNDAKYLWGITGTPLLRGLESAYGQASMVNPAKVRYRSHWEFRNAVQRKVNDFLWVDRFEGPEMVREMLQPAIYIKKADCIDLPPVVHVYREVPLDKGQIAFYRKLKDDRLVQDAQMKVTADNAAVLAGKLIQVATGCIYDDDGQALEFNVKGRIDETADAIRKARMESGDINKGKTLVFVPYKHSLDLVVRKLKEEDITIDGKKRKMNVSVIDGSVSAKRRDETFAKFYEDPKHDVIVAIPSTMSHGVTTTFASCIVFFGPVTSSEVYVQACNRIDRPGQTEKMTIVNLYGTPAEWKLYNNLRENKHNQSVVLDFYDDFIRGI